MAAKLTAYAARAGVADVALVADAYHIAMQPRLRYLASVFHPDMLHPARTALILLENAGCTDARVLAAAQVTETLTSAMRVPSRDIAMALGDQVAELALAVPDPAAREETLVEELVTADEDVALIAVAERLDHARHLHMRDAAGWPAYFRQTVSVYLPLAERVNEELFLRFQRWANAFQRRLS
jgi:(p)ppGpp synthase/HD superfamily hydrolase